MNILMLAAFLRRYRHNSEIGGWMGFIMLICLVVLAVYFGIGRIKKVHHYHKHTKYYRAQVQKIDFYTYDDYYKGRPHERKVFCIYFSWMDDEDGYREDMIELDRPKFWRMRQKETVNIAVIRGKVKQKSAPVPVRFSERKDSASLRQEKELRHVGIANVSAMYIPEERVMFLYQRIGHTLYTIFYVLIIMIPALLIPLAIIIPAIIEAMK
ncbi:MAG: hypothetical protein J6S92_02975 [Oscillospiraceae bacterium]|nr:hypothetical protein [Oscillospiraceae bacterium]